MNLMSRMKYNEEEKNIDAYENGKMMLFKPKTNK